MHAPLQRLTNDVLLAQGKILMTHPTKAIFGTLLRDFAKLGVARAAEDQLFSENDLKDSLTKIDVVDFHQTVEVKGVKVWHLIASGRRHSYLLIMRGVQYSRGEAERGRVEEGGRCNSVKVKEWCGRLSPDRAGWGWKFTVHRLNHSSA